MFEGASRGEDGEADDVQHEQSNALQIDDKYFSSEGRDREEGGADEEDLHHKDGDDRLKVSP